MPERESETTKNIDSSSQTSEENHETTFQEIYNQNHKSVISLAYRITRNYHIAEEVAQEVFLHLCRCLRRRMVIKEPFAWLKRITTNTALNVKKYEMVRSTLPLNDQILATSQSGPREDVERGEKVMALNQAIATLPEKQKITLALRFLDDKSYTEIAETLGCSLDVARKSAERAMVHLRKALEPLR